VYITERGVLSAVTSGPWPRINIITCLASWENHKDSSRPCAAYVMSRFMVDARS